MGVAQVLYFGVQLVGTVVVARILKPYEFGVYAVAMAIIGVLSTLQSIGMNAFIVREPDLTPALRSSAFTMNAIISIVVAITAAATSGAAGMFLREPGVVRVMVTLAFVPLISLFEFLPAAMLERNAQFPQISIIQSAQTIINQGLTIYLALQGFSYMSMAYATIATSVFGALAYNVAGAEYASLAWSMHSWRRLLKFGVNMLAISGVNAIATKLSEFVLGRVVGLSALGLYSRASNVHSLAWVNIHLLIGRVVFVDLAASRRAGAAMRPAYLRIVEMVTALLWPVFGGLAIVAGPFIQLVYGPAWVAASHPLVMLSIAGMVMVSITMTWEVFVISQETERQARIEVLRTGFGVILFSAGCFLSLTAAAAARIGEALFSVVIYRPYLDRMTNTHTADFIPIYLNSAVLTLAAVGPAALVMGQHGWSENTPMPIVFSAIAVGVLQWLALLFILKHPLSLEAKRLWRGFGSRLAPSAR
jgi:O-antigen/teichoic acid export membrane protein